MSPGIKEEKICITCIIGLYMYNIIFMTESMLVHRIEIYIGLYYSIRMAVMKHAACYRRMGFVGLVLAITLQAKINSEGYTYEHNYGRPSA